MIYKELNELIATMLAERSDRPQSEVWKVPHVLTSNSQYENTFVIVIIWIHERTGRSQS